MPFELNEMPSATVLIVKTAIGNRVGVFPSQLRLVFGGKMLADDDASLGDCGLVNGSSINVIVDALKVDEAVLTEERTESKPSLAAPMSFSTSVPPMTKLAAVTDVEAKDIGFGNAQGLFIFVVSQHSKLK